MKKLLSIALVLLLVVGLVACTKEPTETKTETKTEAAPTEITLWTYPIGNWGKEEEVK